MAPISFASSITHIPVIHHCLFPSQKACTLKGNVPIASIRAVENADAAPFDKKFMLQIVYDDAVLYLASDTKIARDEWFD